MADPATRPPSPPAPAGGKPATGKGLLQGKVLGVPKPVAVFGVAAGGTLLFLWWRSRRGSATPTSSAVATSTASATADAEAAQLAALQSEIQGLLAEQTSSGGGGAGATSPPTSRATSTATSSAPAHGKPTHAPVASSSGVTSDGARLFCGSLEFATQYHWRVWKSTRAHPVVSDHTTAYTTYQVSGLEPHTKYGFHVAGVNKAGQGPYSPNQYFTTKGAGHIMHPGATGSPAGGPA